MSVHVSVFVCFTPPTTSYLLLPQASRLPGHPVSPTLTWLRTVTWTAVRSHPQAPGGLCKSLPAICGLSWTRPRDDRGRGGGVACVDQKALQGVSSLVLALGWHSAFCPAHVVAVGMVSKG